MQLLAGKQIDDPGASDSGLHQHEAGMLGGHFADDGGLCASGWDRGQNSASLAGRDNGLELAFVGDIQRVETKNLAGSLISRRHPPGPFRSASRAPKRLRRKASSCGGKLIFDNSWKETFRGSNDLSQRDSSIAGRYALVPQTMKDLEARSFTDLSARVHGRRYVSPSVTAVPARLEQIPKEISKWPRRNGLSARKRQRPM